MNDEESVDYINSNGDANNVKNSNHSDKTVILIVAIVRDSNDLMIVTILNYRL